MRPTYPIRYDTNGRGHLVVAPLDAGFVVSARFEYATGSPCWHFGYSRAQQHGIADVLSSSHALRCALLMVWYDAVDPDLDGYHPVARLTVHLGREAGWVEFISGERREDGSNIGHVSVSPGAADAPVRIGRDIYQARPNVSLELARSAGVEYVNTGSLPQSIRWQRPTDRVPQGAFGRQLVPDEDLPPRFLLEGSPGRT